MSVPWEQPSVVAHNTQGAMAHVAVPTPTIHSRQSIADTPEVHPLQPHHQFAPIPSPDAPTGAIGSRSHSGAYHQQAQHYNAGRHYQDPHSSRRGPQRLSSTLVGPEDEHQSSLTMHHHHHQQLEGGQYNHQQRMVDNNTPGSVLGGATPGSVSLNPNQQLQEQPQQHQPMQQQVERREQLLAVPDPNIGQFNQHWATLKNSINDWFPKAKHVDSIPLPKLKEGIAAMSTDPAVAAPPLLHANSASTSTAEFQKTSVHPRLQLDHREHWSQLAPVTQTTLEFLREYAPQSSNSSGPSSTPGAGGTQSWDIGQAVGASTSRDSMLDTALVHLKRVLDAVSKVDQDRSSLTTEPGSSSGPSAETPQPQTKPQHSTANQTVAFLSKLLRTLVMRANLEREQNAAQQTHTLGSSPAPSSTEISRIEKGIAELARSLEVAQFEADHAAAIGADPTQARLSYMAGLEQLMMASIQLLEPSRSAPNAKRKNGPPGTLQEQDDGEGGFLTAEGNSLGDLAKGCDVVSLLLKPIEISYSTRYAQTLQDITTVEDALLLRKTHRDNILEYSVKKRQHVLHQVDKLEGQWKSASQELDAVLSKMGEIHAKRVAMKEQVEEEVHTVFVQVAVVEQQVQEAERLLLELQSAKGGLSSAAEALILTRGVLTSARGTAERINNATLADNRAAVIGTKYLLHAAGKHESTTKQLVSDLEEKHPRTTQQSSHGTTQQSNPLLFQMQARSSQREELVRQYARQDLLAATQDGDGSNSSGGQQLNPVTDDGSGTIVSSRYGDVQVPRFPSLDQPGGSPPDTNEGRDSSASPFEIEVLTPSQAAPPPVDLQELVQKYSHPSAAPIFPGLSHLGGGVAKQQQPARASALLDQRYSSNVEIGQEPPKSRPVVSRSPVKEPIAQENMPVASTTASPTEGNKKLNEVPMSRLSALAQEIPPRSRNIVPPPQMMEISAEASSRMKAARSLFK